VPAHGNQASPDPAPSDVPEDDTSARPEPPPRFLTVPEVAEILGVSEKTVRRRIADGGLRKAPFGGRIIRIAAAELRRLGRS
jgi:excisionase family DNA binding protein